MGFLALSKSPSFMIHLPLTIKQCRISCRDIVKAGKRGSSGILNGEKHSWNQPMTTLKI